MRRSAFTLLELLVVIGIIVVLIALLLPAVQKVRSSATLVQCRNNLKQLALGIHHYHQAYRRLPRGVANVNDTSDAGNYLLALRPYIEQTNASPNDVVRLYLCPADSSAGDLGPLGSAPVLLKVGAG